jgi:tetratricopeptide (TPR) repeat protein
VRESVAATGIKLREPRYEEFPFQFDDLVKAVEEVEEKGDWLYASQIFEYMCENYRNELWMKTRWANALYHAGRYDEALSIAEELNLKRPTVSTLLIEARIHRKRDDVSLAIEQFEKAEDILQGSELAWSH